MTRIAQLLGMREAEWKRTFLLQIYLFNLICVLLLLKPVSNALLISTFGIEGLPIVFIFIAIAAFAFTKLYNNLYQKYQFISLFKGFMYFIIVSLAFFMAAFYLFPEAEYLVFAFYVWVALYALVSTSQFWILCNIVFNTREAKRVFGVIGSGGIAGGIAGGYLASILVSYTSNVGLILIAVILLIATIPITNRIWNKHKSSLKEGSLVTAKRKKKIQSFSFRRLSKNRHILLLSFITGVGVMIAKLVDYQFQNFASLRFDNPEELTAFFGFWLSTFNVVGFIVQLFFTGRILKYLGVDKTQFILPISLLLVSSISFFIPILAIFIALRGTEGVFKQSIQRSVNELLIMPIAPEIKSQSKTFIDVFVDSVATGISGILLLSLFAFGMNDIRLMYVVTILIIVLSLLWLSMSFLVKRSYIESFRKQFLKVDKREKEIVGPSTLFNSIDELFDLHKEQEILDLLKNLKDFNLGTRVIMQLLQHKSAKVRLKVLQMMPTRRDKDLLKIVATLHSDPNLSVRVDSYLYTLQYDRNFTLENQKHILNGENQEQAMACLFACAAFYTNDLVSREGLDIYDRIRSVTEIFLVESSSVVEDELLVFELLKAIARGRYVSLYQYIDQLLNSDSIWKESAIRACSFTLSRKYAERLIHFLQDPVFGIIAQESLFFYDEAVIKIVDDLRLTGQIGKQTFYKCFELLAKMPSQNALNYLLGHLNNKSYAIRREVIWQLSSMKRSFPYLDYKSNTIYKRVEREVKSIRKLLSIYQTFFNELKQNPSKDLSDLESLIHDIMRRIRQQIDKRLINVFLVLGLEHNNQDIHDVYNGLTSKNDLRKAYSIEFMDMLVDYRYTKLMSPIVEVCYQNDYSSESIIKTGITARDFSQAFASIAKYPDREIILLLAQLVQYEDYKGFAQLLKKNDLIKKNLYLLKRLNSINQGKQVK